MPYHRVTPIDRQAFFVGASGTIDAEAVVEELGDEVLVGRILPEGVDECRAKCWSAGSGRWSVW